MKWKATQIQNSLLNETQIRRLARHEEGVTSFLVLAAPKVLIHHPPKSHGQCDFILYIHTPYLISTLPKTIQE